MNFYVKRRLVKVGNDDFYINHYDEIEHTEGTREDYEIHLKTFEEFEMFYNAVGYLYGYEVRRKLSWLCKEKPHVYIIERRGENLSMFEPWKYRITKKNYKPITFKMTFEKIEPTIHEAMEMLTTKEFIKHVKENC